MTLIALDAGHNCFPDIGAYGVKFEDEMNSQIASILLLDKSFEFVYCAPKKAYSVNDSLLQRTQKANRANANYFVSIHHNALNGKAFGTEIYYASEKGKKLAAPILEEICKLGFYNRGLKQGDFFVLRDTAMPAILIEVCFCDSKKDTSIWDAGKVANAIARGLKRAI